jgi:hypothetical protein
LAPNLLTIEQCRELVKKVGSDVKPSKSWDAKLGKMVLMTSRTSDEVRIPPEETPVTQGIFQKLLDMPTKNMEPMKIQRYNNGQKFEPHHDCRVTGYTTAPACPTINSNRVVTLFTYLTSCEAGGETQFNKYHLKIKPRAGMGVIHFPAYLNTATYQGPAKFDAPLEKGMRVRGKWTPGSKKSPHVHGTIKSVNHQNGTVEIDMETPRKANPDKGHTWTGDEWVQEYTISSRGKLDAANPSKDVDFEVLSDMRGARDDRTLHEGMPAAEGDEKFIATQWCWCGPFDYSKDEKMKAGGTAEVQPLGNRTIL